MRERIHSFFLFGFFKKAHDSKNEESGEERKEEKETYYAVSGEVHEKIRRLL